MTAAPRRRFTDIPETGWVARAPAWARPYLRLARLDRPIGTWLLLWPCWWSLAMAADQFAADQPTPAHLSGVAPWPDPVLLVLFGLGALLMRGAGCCWNDIADRDIDGRVERTASRPLPAGELTVAQAVACMVVLALAAFAILLSFNLFAIGVGVASLATVAIYPFMKRFTWWPQFFLGLAFNWGALLGWAAVTGEIGLPAILLYAGGIAWTLGYDTIYAHQDKEDDALVGIKSSARRLGAATRPALWVFYGVALALFVLAIWHAGTGIWAGPLLALAAAQLAWPVLRVDLDNPASCLAAFHANNRFGLLLFAAIVAGNVLG